MSGGTTSEIRYVDATPQRKGRADDIAFRSMPAHAQTRYAAGLEKMSIYGIEATFGEVAKNEWFLAFQEWEKFGDHVYVSFNEDMRDGKMVRDNVKLNDAYFPRAAQADAKEPGLLDQSMGRPDELPLLETAGRGRDGYQRGDGPAAFLRGDEGVQDGRFPDRRGEVQGGVADLEAVMEDYPTYREDELSKKDTGRIVERYVRVLNQNLTPIPDDLPFKEY